METKMMTVISNYGKVMREFGVTNPVFLLTKEAYLTLMNPDGPEFKESVWVLCTSLNEELQKFPGTIGMYDGVLLVRAYNVNQPLSIRSRSL